MNALRQTARLDQRLPQWVASFVSGGFLLVALGPFAVYGADYLYFWIYITFPFCLLPLNLLLPNDVPFVLGITLLAAASWGGVSYLVVRLIWRRIHSA